jgi:hypothetical protein
LTVSRSFGCSPTRTTLRELKEYQAGVRLMDDVAEEAVRAVGGAA